MKDVKIQFSREINQWRNLHKLQIADSFGGWMEMKIPPSLRTEKALKIFYENFKEFNHHWLRAWESTFLTAVYHDDNVMLVESERHDAIRNGKLNGKILFTNFSVSFLLSIAILTNLYAKHDDKIFLVPFFSS